MAWVSLGLSGLFGLLAVGLRSWIHTRRTGRSPIRQGAGMSGWMALGALALLFVAGPVAELSFGATRLVDSAWLAGPGLALSIAGLAALLWSQSSMGDSLRIGVDPAERTSLVTAGPFRWVRNPIYSAMLLYVAGVALLVPNAASFVAFGVLAIGLDLHVRLGRGALPHCDPRELLRQLRRACGPLRSGGGQVPSANRQLTSSRITESII